MPNCLTTGRCAKKEVIATRERNVASRRMEAARGGAVPLESAERTNGLEIEPRPAKSLEVLDVERVGKPRAVHKLQTV